jgi:hypothetical protein
MTPDQHKIAQMNCTAHYIWYEMIWDLVEGQNVDIIKQMVAEIDDKMEEGIPWYQAVEGIKKVRDYLPTAINEPHMGDCIKMPCTCMRCLAEEYYEVESTIPP